MAEYPRASGFAQIPPVTGLVRNDTSAKFRLGTVISDTDGNSYRYIKAAEALAVGQCVTATARAAWTETSALKVDGAIVANTTNILHIDGNGSATAAFAANKYAGYYVSQATAAGLGMSYRIKEHAAFAASGEGDIILEETMQESFADNVALLIFHPSVVELVDADTEQIMGVALGTIPPGSYGFIQIGGYCAKVQCGHSTSAAIVLNEPLVPVSAVPGAVQGMAGNAETDIMEAAACPLLALRAVAANTTGYVEAFIKGLV